jgi:predicted amidophosphoribosyltransferase
MKGNKTSANINYTEETYNLQTRPAKTREGLRGKVPQIQEKKKEEKRVHLDDTYTTRTTMREAGSRTTTARVAVPKSF